MPLLVIESVGGVACGLVCGGGLAGFEIGFCGAVVDEGAGFPL
ncbi:hypothetical protein [Xylella fastidiosa]|nr:hypothetical protein [Xylella fastidiosa]AIC14131.1 hypothetical protein P303_12000 [Xylella fastidiosa MUL0034]AIC14135.1 hypothetical protein P303_12025 [Xylella fastidiosa MUL0034]